MRTWVAVPRERRERASRASHANGASRRSGERESVQGSPRDEASRIRLVRQNRADAVANFAGCVISVWKNNATWSQVHSGTPSKLRTGGLDGRSAVRTMAAGQVPPRLLVQPRFSMISAAAMRLFFVM